MARYRTVHVQIWNDPDFQSCIPDAKLVFLHILTTPMSSPFGAFKASKAALSDELDLDPEDEIESLKRFSEGFAEGLAKGFFEYDEKARFLYLPNFMKYNKPANPNVLVSWGKIFEELPNCELKQKVYESIEASINLKIKGFKKAFTEGFTEPFPNGSSKALPNGSPKGLSNRNSNSNSIRNRREAAEFDDDDGPGDAEIDSYTWCPDSLETDAVKVMGITDDQIQKWLPAFRLLIRQREGEGNPLTVHSVGKSFRRFCQLERSNETEYDPSIDYSKADADRLSAAGYESHDQYIAFSNAISQYKNDRQLGVKESLSMFDDFPEHLKQRAFHMIEDL